MVSVKQLSGTSDEKVALQTRLLQTPGTPWYTVTNGTLRELQALFPKGCKHSLQARDRRNRLLSEVEEGLEEHVSTATTFTPTVPLGSAFQIPDNEAAEESVQRDVSGKCLVERVDIYDRGTVGENIFHLCVLTRSQDPEGRLMIRWLVEVFGSELINCPYQERDNDDDPPGLYEGETVLHIAIANQDMEMVQLFMENGADLSARAFGDFFSPNGNCYYGEYPLSFAVSTGSISMVQYLVGNGADVNADCDRYGRFAVHMAVVHRNPQMYTFLVEQCGASQAVRDRAGYTPLELAASKDDNIMFTFVLRQMRQVSWKYGPVTCYKVPLTELDTIQDTREDCLGTALRTIVDAGSNDLIVNELIVMMLQTKWTRFAKWMFYTHVALYIFDLGVFCLLVDLQRYEFGTGERVPILAPSLYIDYPCEEGRFECVPLERDWLFGERRFCAATVLIQVSNIIMSSVHVILEAYDFYCWNTDRLFRQNLKRKRVFDLGRRTPKVVPIPGQSSDSAVLSGKMKNKHISQRSVATAMRKSVFPMFEVLDADNDGDLDLHDVGLLLRVKQLMRFQKYLYHHPESVVVNLACLLRLAHAVNWIQGWETNSSYELALASICVFCYGFFFARGFRSFGHLVVMLGQMALDDILVFMVIFCIILGGFSCSFFLLIRKEFVDETTQTLPGEYVSLYASAMSLIRSSLGDMSFSIIRGTHENSLIEAIIVSLFVAWCIVSNVVMINLLIALMGNTFNKVEENAERAWRLQWARIILQIERRLPSSYQQRFRLGEVIEGKHWHVFEEVSKDSDAHQAELQSDLLGRLESSFDRKDQRRGLRTIMRLPTFSRTFSMPIDE